MAKLTLEEWADEIDWQILALSTHAEDYFLAYQLNKALGCRLRDSKQPFTLVQKNNTILFSCFTSAVNKKSPLIYLVKNQSYSTTDTAGLGGLFAEEAGTSVLNLIQSLKRWDYLLITPDSDWLQSIMPQIKILNIASNLFSYNNLNNKEQKILTILSHDK